MSRKTVAWRKKFGQMKGKGVDSILPLRSVASSGKKMRFASSQMVDEDGNTTGAGKRAPGIRGASPCSLPMGAEKEQRIRKLLK